MLKRIKELKGASIDSLLLTFMQFVTYATGMVTTKLISTALSLEDYGTYASVNVTITIAATFTLLGLGDCLNYYYNNNEVCKNEKDRISYVNTIYFAQMIIGIIVSLILFAFRNVISNYFGNVAIAPLLLIVCVKPWFENTIHLFQVLFVSVGRAKIIAIRNFLLALIRVIIVYISLNIFANLSLVFILLVMVDIVQIVTFSTFFSKTNFQVNPLCGDLKKLYFIFSYSIPMGVYFITNSLMRELDKLVVGKLGTQTQLAIYTNSSKQLPVNLFVTSFATVLVPYIMQYVSEKKGDQAAELFKNYMKLGYMTIWMLSGAILISAEQIIPFLYSDDYLQGKSVFIVYIIVGMIQFASMHLIVAANGNSRFLMYLSIAMLGLNIGLNVTLFYVFSAIGYSLIGPAIATVIVTTLYTIIVLKKSVEILNTRIVSLFDLKELVVYLVQLLVVGMVMWYFKGMLIHIGLHRYFAMIITSVVYCGIIFMLHLKDYIKILKIINKCKLNRKV